jgi:TonB family protein
MAQWACVSPQRLPAQLEVSMKRCTACQEEFADKFTFCPIDARRLISLAHVASDGVLEAVADRSKSHAELQLTIINTRSLLNRLSGEVLFAFNRLRSRWPEFKEHPLQVARTSIASFALVVRRTLLQPNALAGLITAVLLVLSAGMALLLSGHKSAAKRSVHESAQDVQILSIAPSSEEPKPQASGVVASSNGRVGFNRGKGEGSAAVHKPAHGGGGGGEQNLVTETVGKIPTPSNIPAPIKPPPPNPALPAAGVDLDAALWRSLPFVNYGDPHAKSATASNGPGTNGGVGSGDGLGVGPGTGNGVGPGKHGNIGDGDKDAGGDGIGGSNGNRFGPRPPYRVSEVEQRARVLSKPEPQYTELARKNLVTGSVLLSVIFSESGEVTGIRAVRSLPDGLTERAIAAARQIRFVPASKNGHPVSVYMQLEYNFNLY